MKYEGKISVIQFYHYKKSFKTVITSLLCPFYAISSAMLLRHHIPAYFQKTSDIYLTEMEQFPIHFNIFIIMHTFWTVSLLQKDT